MRGPLTILRSATAAVVALALITITAQAQDAKSLSRPDAPAIGAKESRKFDLPDFPEVTDKVKRMPTVSPDGKTVAFCHAGDIWSAPREGGVAKRLTITEDNEWRPLYSPDGQWIAFRSMRYGGYDLFIMPAEGGKARRLTWHDASDYVSCWLPDSSGLIFSSARRNSAYDLYCMKIDGSAPWPISDGGYRNNEQMGQVSPDGTKITYVRGGGMTSYRRRGYQGSASNDIWVCDFDGRLTSNHKPLVVTPFNETTPLWGDDNMIIYTAFTKESPRLARLMGFDLKTNKSMPLPGETEELRDLRELSMSDGGIAFSTGAYGGWKMGLINLEDGSIEWPKIELKSDVRNAGMRLTRHTSPSEFATSKNGKLIAFVAGGEIYLKPTAGGSTPKRLTTTIGRELDLQFSPDSKSLLYTAERGGKIDLYLYDLEKGSESRLTESKVSASNGRFMPDGKTIFYCDGESVLRDIDLAGKQGTLEIDGNFHGAIISTGPLFAISPKGRWIAFPSEDERGKDTIKLADLHSDAKIHGLTRLLGNSYAPSFSDDGKRLTFMSNEVDDYDIFVVDLQSAGVEFAEDKLADVFKKPEPKKAAPAKKEEKKEGEKPADAKEEKKPEEKAPEAKKEPVEEIDFADLGERTQRLTSLSGHEVEPILVSGGKSVVFINGSDLYSVNVPSIGGRASVKKLTTTTGGKSQLRLAPDGKSLWMIENRKIAKYSTSGKPAGSHSVNVTHRDNVLAMRTKVFEEACFIHKNYFYDANMHGVEWDKVCAQYAKVLPAVATYDSFASVMNELFGELNSSHQGFSTADPRTDGYSESVGHLGLHFDAGQLADGHFLVSEVIKNGPCDYRGSTIKAGTYLVGVNDTFFAANPGRGVILSRLLLDSIGKKTELHFATSPDSGTHTSTPVKPTTSRTMSELYYQRWVRAQRAYVHKLSNGQLGYVHIRRQDGGSLQHFKHHLGDENIGTKGLVVDVRFNGGGSTAVHQLEILYKKSWLLRRPRGSKHYVSENIYRSKALEKPTALLINQNSFSNAEILAEGFRYLKLGPIIGVETGGGVIGTTRFTLIDGSTMRLPLSGAYAMNGENLENNGREPDFEVHCAPADLDRGVDLQTATAVSELLKKLK